MGLLDELLGSLAGKGGRSGGLGGLGDLLGGAASGTRGGGRGNALLSLLPLVLMLLQNRGASGASAGGLGGLLQQLQAQGLGAQADSWVGTGANLPVSPDELTNALGRDRIHDLATQAGLSDDEASGGLASLLPELVDRLTPGGRLPADSGQVDTALADLQRSLGI